MVQAIKWFYN